MKLRERKIREEALKIREKERSAVKRFTRQIKKIMSNLSVEKPHLRYEVINIFNRELKF